MKLAFMVVACGALTACATPYQEQGFLGGVHATRVDETTVQIAARGNAYTDADTINHYAIRKAAEETLADGFDLFLIVNAADRTRQGSFVTNGSATTNTSYFAGTATSQTTYNPGQVVNFVKPGETMTIKLFKGAKPANAPSNLFDAREVLKYIVAGTTKK